MRRSTILLAVGLTAGSAWAQTKAPIALRDMGSFHIGGRIIEISGQPTKEVVFTPGGVPAKIETKGEGDNEEATSITIGGGGRGKKGKGKKGKTDE